MLRILELFCLPLLLFLVSAWVVSSSLRSRVMRYLRRSQPSPQPAAEPLSESSSFLEPGPGATGTAKSPRRPQPPALPPQSILYGVMVPALIPHKAHE